VWDLAEAHILAMKYLEQDGGISEFNLGIGKGYSVNEVIDSIRTVTNIDIPVKIKPRRPGDPDRLVASNRKAKQVLGWVPKYAGIDEIVQSAWKWHSSHPDGFSGEK
jgi:UDP-glucose 4-epimerase